MSYELEQKRVRWRCNRGMLELDLFLIPFAQNHYPQLSEVEKAQFVSLLQCEDPTIYGWMMGHEAVPDDMQEIVLKIKQAKHT